MEGLTNNSEKTGLYYFNYKTKIKIQQYSL